MQKNKKIIFISIIVIALCLCGIFIAKNILYSQNEFGKNSSNIVIVDMAGRKVTIPKTVNKIYTTSPVGQIFIYTLNPDKLAGWNYKLSDMEKKYIDPKYWDLPVLGGSFGKNSSLNPEVILNIKPDIIINMANIDQTAISSSNQLQKQLNIPVVMVDGSLTKLDKSYTFAGNIIGEKNKANELAKFCKDSISYIQDRVSSVPENKKTRIYYAEGPKGLETDPQGSQHTEVIDLVGGINIANVSKKTGYGRSEVSFEQVLVWNPDLILICPETGSSNPFYQNIFKDNKWNKLEAVKNKKVVMVPYGPFNWFDRPPSVNRVLGSLWLANLLYPDVYKYDIKAKTKDFYQKFYHYNLSDKEVNELLQNAKLVK
ncbi:MAG: ABC transporter substrate-binding protein [Bacillota bacterium]